MESDKKRAKIGLLLLIFPIVIFTVNDFLFFGLGSSIFYGLVALRGGLLVYTIAQLFILNRVKSYSTFSVLMAFWTVIAALCIIIINLTRPVSFVPLQLVSTILFVLITFAVIPNRLRYQLIPAAIISFGEIGILLFYLPQMTANTFTTGSASLILAFSIGLASSWQLDVYRKNNFEAHESLKQSRDRSEAKYEQLVEKLPEMVFELDNQGHVVFANLKARELTGYTKEEFEDNFDANRLVAPEDVERSKTNMKLMFTSGRRHSDEYVWIRKDGKRFPVQLTSAPVMENERIVGTRGIVTDLTEQKKLARELQDKERLAAIGQTAGMVGHDIRNPLQAIMSDTYLLKDELSSLPVANMEGAVESIDSIEKNVVYINKIVQDLQDFARPITPEFTEANLSNILVNIFETISVPVSIKLSINMKDVETLRTDSMLLQRALTNLITNAIQAMPSGGNLEICGQPVDNCAVITVVDTGQGIPEDVKPLLFTPMMTTKAKGQGFGLAASKRIIEAMKGSICFESEEGKGTKFIVKLPLY